VEKLNAKRDGLENIVIKLDVKRIAAVPKTEFAITEHVFV